MKGTRLYVMAALLAAVLCVLGPLAVPVGPVPISLATLWICLAAGLLGARGGVLCVAVYLLLGAMGLPVFSSFAGGTGVLAGPTGGYLVGYLPLALCTGLGAARGPRTMFLGMLAGTVSLYGLGSWWFCLQTESGLVQALAICVAPFLPFDAVKIAAVLLLLPRISQSLKKAGYL